MILIASKEEKELIQHLRSLQPVGEAQVLTEQILSLKKQLVELEIQKDKQLESHAREERELRHMIGLEKKRQEVELAQAKKDTELTLREGNLVEDKKRFEEQLKFNTSRFETMEKYLKDLNANILERLPMVTVDVKRK